MRCGAWYTAPDRLDDTAYFKSTDGHMRHWDFSLKRANLHLVPWLETGAPLTGLVLVDSTRRGKSYPDALSKTAPIWCAVLNRASQKLHGSPATVPDLAVPRDAVSASEAAQIEALLAQWVDKLCASDLAVPRLTKPLVPVFARAPEVPALSANEQHHIVLVSVSPTTAPDFHTPGATYVQGAGDDHEAWALGLTPALFWRHRLALCNAQLSRAEREDMVHALVTDARSHGGAAWVAPDHAPVPIQGTALVLQRVPHDHVFSAQDTAPYALVVHATQAACAVADEAEPVILRLGLEDAKRGLSAFSRALPGAVDHITSVLLAESTTAQPRPVLLCCPSGGTLSGALAVAVLAASMDEHRQLIGAGQVHEAPALLTAHRRTLTKDTTQRRLQWVTSSVSDVAPSRALLQRVNAFLMGPGRQVRLWP